MRKMAFAVAVAFLFVGGGATAVAKDDPKELERNCDAGDLDACVKLGRVYARWGALDSDIPEDRARAYSLFQKACDGGLSEGCYCMGYCYLRGWGVQKDLTRAASLFEKACEGKSKDGCVALGRAYEAGDGVSQDYALADSLFEQACNLGSYSGCGSVAGLHDPQKGVLKDTARWAAFMERCCDDDSGDICLKLGLVYDLGMWGVPKDTDHATELFKKGCLFQNKEACDLIRR